MLKLTGLLCFLTEVFLLLIPCVWKLNTNVGIGNGCDIEEKYESYTPENYSFSHNHGSEKWLYLKGNYYWRDPFSTSMIMRDFETGIFTYMNC